MRTHIAEECKNDYAAQLQKYNKEQNQFYFTDMPLIFNVRSTRLSPNMSRRICSYQLTMGMIPNSLADFILISRVICMLFSLQNLQDMDERRIKKMAQGYIQFADTERQVMPIIGKCLEGITRAGTNVNERNVSRVAFLRKTFPALIKPRVSNPALGGPQSCRV